ncbi:MAG: hypothetical protein ACPLRA_05365 [Candidatus Saccharicenans sp.]
MPLKNFFLFIREKVKKILIFSLIGAAFGSGTILAMKQDFAQKVNLSQPILSQAGDFTFGSFSPSGLYLKEINFIKSEQGNFDQQASRDIKKEAVKEEEVLRAKIGSGPDELGVVTPEEANPEGPMSFVVSLGGEVYVLDQINSRIQVFKSGKRTRTIPLPGQTFTDIELMPDGRIALMDNLVNEEVFIINQKGQIEEKIPLKRVEIPEPGAITGIYCRSEGPWPGLWAEVENGFILIAGLDGKPNTEMKSLPGLLTSSGRRFLKIEIAGEKQVKVYRSEEDLKTWNGYQISFELPLGIVYGPWEDKEGRIYLAANTFDEKSEANEMVILGPGGKERGRIKLALSSGIHEVLKPLQVTPDGNIYQLVIESGGVVIRKYSHR